MNARQRQLDEAIAGQSGARDARQQAIDDEAARESARREEERKRREKGDSRGFWTDMLKRMGQ